MRLDLVLAPALLALLSFSALPARADECSNCTANSTANVTNETVATTPEPIVYEKVFYRLYFPHKKCAGGVDGGLSRPDPLNVSLPSNISSYTLQEVMEAATDQDEAYQFSLLYLSEDLGYLLEGVNGTDEEGDCKWRFYYQAPGEEEPSLLHDVPTLGDQLRVSLIDVVPNATVVLCYLDTAPSEETSSVAVDPPTSSSQPTAIAPSSTTTSSSSSSTETSSATAPTNPPTTSSQPLAETPTTDIPTPPKRSGAVSHLSVNSNFLSPTLSTLITLCLYNNMV